MSVCNDKISVIVPIYNVEAELDRCVESIVRQTYANLEIILVDDGSPDKCPQMCDEYKRYDDRIVVIHKENGGLSDARNIGLENATGRYIMYVDSDDYIQEDSCEKLIQYMKNEVDIVVGACKIIDTKKNGLMRHSNLVSGRLYSSEEFIIKSIKKNEWYAPAWLNLYKRQFLIDNKLYYKKGYIYEDIEILPRLFLAAKGVVYVDYLFYNYIIRENSIMTTNISELHKNMVSDIYNSWYNLISQICDEKLKRYMFGIMIRYYITSARRVGLKGWKVQNFDFKFANKYALNLKERVKVLIFTMK